MEEIALLISRETGKPLAEAISMELAPTLDLMQYFARKGAHMLQPRRISVGQYALMGRSSYEIYRPLGVIGIVSPWNFPWATPLAEVVMALLAGNTVVLKPSELTPLTGLKIKDVLERAGLPDGVLQVVTGDGSTGAALVGAGVDKIMFTGSVATGKRVAEAAAKYLTRWCWSWAAKIRCWCWMMRIFPTQRAEPFGAPLQTRVKPALPSSAAMFMKASPRNSSLRLLRKRNGCDKVPALTRRETLAR